MSPTHCLSTCCAFLASAIVLTAPAHADGRIVAIGDEWTFSDSGFAGAPAEAADFALNCASLLAGRSGKILAYSSNFSLSGTSLSALLNGQGYQFVHDISQPFTLATLQQYDAVWLAGTQGSGAANAQVLIDYVHAGGNVLVSAGTGEFGGPGGEAASWSPFLGTFGLAFGSTWFPVTILITPPLLPNSNPMTQGVSTMVWGYGQTAFETRPSNTATDAVSADFAQWSGGTQFVIATYLPDCGTPCPADLDGSGVVDAADLSIFLGEWGSIGGPADFDCDGTVDAADLSVLLGSWGRC